jgi:hypothetical protein
MNNATGLLQDCEGYTYMYNPRSFVLKIMPLDMVDPKECNRCGCAPCILAYFDSHNQDLGRENEELFNCEWFPFLTCWYVWLGYLNSFEGMTTDMGRPKYRFQKRLEECLFFTKEIAHPAISGAHRLWGYKFPTKRVSSYIMEICHSDLADNVTRGFWDYFHHAEQFYDNHYPLGSMCIYLLTNISYVPEVISKVAGPIGDWMDVVEEVRDSGIVQKMLSTVYRAIKAGHRVEESSLESFHDMGTCLGDIGHIDLMSPEGLIAAHVPVSVAPWQADYAPPRFVGDTNVARHLVKLSKIMWKHSTIVGGNYDYFFPDALTLESGAMGQDDSCPLCTHPREDAQLAEARRLVLNPAWRDPDVLGGDPDDYAVCLGEWLARLGSYKSRPILARGRNACLHDRNAECEFALYNGVRGGLSLFFPEGAVQVGMSTLRGGVLRGGAKALIQQRDAPTMRCCGYSSRGPACNEMGVMLR